MYNYFISNFLYQDVINILRREELYIQNELFKRVWVIVIIVIFFGIIAIPFTSGNFSVNNDNISKINVNSTIPTNSISNREVIDQQQIDYSGGTVSFDNNYLLIQSFQPAREWITKIELYLSKSNHSIIPKHIIVSIREEINGFDVQTYRPIRDYGVWGVRYGRKGKACNTSGNRGAQQELSNSKRILIGSQ